VITFLSWICSLTYRYHRLRAQLNATLEKDQKISVNDFIVKASAIALRRVPTVNNSWLGTAIRVNHTVDVCVAVQTETGYVPDVAVIIGVRVCCDCMVVCWLLLKLTSSFRCSLITPIVKNADLIGVGEIAKTTKDLAERARGGKLALNEFQVRRYSSLCMLWSCVICVVTHLCWNFCLVWFLRAGWHFHHQ